MIRKLIICIAVLVGFCPMAWGTVDDVPNPKTYNADNWVSDPDHILDSETKNKINNILQQLEDSLTIEVAVVALNSIGEEDPHEFAVTLFNRWGVGKAEDDNGLLILLTRDIRDITSRPGMAWKVYCRMPFAKEYRWKPWCRIFGKMTGIQE